LANGAGGEFHGENFVMCKVEGKKLENKKGRTLFLQPDATYADLANSARRFSGTLIASQDHRQAFG